jgi:D-inositol-3-phosphate glycosyltransferase
MTVVEAQASGVPVVVSRSGGIPELVKPGETGFIVNSGDVEGLRVALASLLSDPAARHRMAVAAAEHARESFGWDQSASALSDALDRYITGPA